MAPAHSHAQLRGRRFAREFWYQWPFLIVILVDAGGFLGGVIWPQHWLRGVSVMAVGLVIGGGLRLVLTAPRAGWLVVRSRGADVFCYLGLGVLVFTFGVLVHR